MRALIKDDLLTFILIKNPPEATYFAICELLSYSYPIAQCIFFTIQGPCQIVQFFKQFYLPFTFVYMKFRLNFHGGRERG